MTGWLAKLFVVGTRPSTCKILGTAPSGVLMKEQRTWDWCVHSRQKRLIWKFAKFEQMHFLKSHYCVKKTLKTDFFFVRIWEVVMNRVAWWCFWVVSSKESTWEIYDNKCV